MVGEERRGLVALGVTVGDVPGDLVARDDVPWRPRAETPGGSKGGVAFPEALVGVVLSGH